MPGTRRRWLVDGMNVIGSQPSGWWRDRQAAKGDLVRALGRFARALEEPVTVVFDGAAPGGVPGVEVRGAPGGPDAADREIARLVAADPSPHELVVVTSDGRLAGQARAGGARVVGAGGFARRLVPAALGSASQEGQPDPPAGVVGVEVDQDQGLPGAELEPAARDRQGEGGAHQDW